MQRLISDYLDGHQLVLSKLEASAGDIQQAAERCIAALANGHKLLICGNGGSATDAQHMAAELVGRFISDRPASRRLHSLRYISAHSDCNDYGYDDCLAVRSLAEYAGDGDCYRLRIEPQRAGCAVRPCPAGGRRLNGAGWRCAKGCATRPWSRPRMTPHTFKGTTSVVHLLCTDRAGARFGEARLAVRSRFAA